MKGSTEGDTSLKLLVSQETPQYFVLGITITISSALEVDEPRAG